MDIKIEFNTDNAAFEDNFITEVERVLNRARAAVYVYASTDGVETLLDTNGNVIGKVTVKGKR